MSCPTFLWHIVVSSHPHATLHLHKQTTVKVDILGFTEKEQQHHIQQSLQLQPQKVKELIQYFEYHMTGSSLCYVPFNLVVLLYLFKEGIPFPNNSTELYNQFICDTINRHHIKHGYPSNITKFTDLRGPFNKIIQQLSKLSLDALNDNRLIFMCDIIKEACPDITDIPGATMLWDSYKQLRTIAPLG